MWRHGLTPGFELMGNPGNLWTDFASGKQVSLLMFLAATVQFLAGYQHIIHDVYIMYKNKWCVMVIIPLDTIPEDTSVQYNDFQQFNDSM